MSAILRLALALSFAASQASAQTTPTCAFTGPTVFPEMEAAKAAFLGGEYKRFFDLAATQSPNTDVTALIAGVSQAVPDGFVSCTTVLQREDIGGLVQEISLFQLSEDRGLITLYLQSALINGQRVIVQVHYDETMEDVLESLR